MTSSVNCATLTADAMGIAAAFSEWCTALSISMRPSRGVFQRSSEAIGRGGERRQPGFGRERPHLHSVQPARDSCSHFLRAHLRRDANRRMAGLMVFAGRMCAGGVEPAGG